MMTDTWLNQLKENGYRLTEARRAVIDTIQNSIRALTPVEVFDLARKKYSALGLAPDNLSPHCPGPGMERGGAPVPQASVAKVSNKSPARICLISFSCVPRRYQLQASHCL